MLGGCIVFYFYFYFILRTKIFRKPINKNSVNQLIKNKRPNWELSDFMSDGDQTFGLMVKQHERRTHIVNNEYWTFFFSRKQVIYHFKYKNE